MADGLVITGPTASGKTAVALATAAALRGEIISMDSRQVYRGMDIGTAKVSLAERRRIPHFGLDLITPDQRYSAGRFAADAARWIAEIRARGHVPVLAGGTGFFLRALTRPMFDEPVVDPGRKEAIRSFFNRFARAELLRWLRVLDPRAADRMTAEGGRQRLARALEVPLLTGRSLSAWHAAAPPTVPLSFATVVLELPRDALYERINTRVEEMVEAGLVDEVKRLLAAGYDEHAPGMNATGYAEIIRYLRGESSLEAAVRDIQGATRSYARRQITWFRHQLEGDVLALDATRPLEGMVDDIVRFWNERKGRVS